MRRLKNNLFLVIIAILSFNLIVFGNLWYVSFDEDFYFDRIDEREFIKVLDYTKGSIDSIEGDFFNSKEKLHLKDVRDIFSKIKILLWGSLILFVFLSFFKKKLILKGVKLGVLFVLVFILLLGVGSAFNFSGLFSNFHEIIFSNNLWLLDPLEDNLIKLLPEEVFLDIVKRLVVNVVISCSVVIGLVKIFKFSFIKDL